MGEGGGLGGWEGGGVTPLRLNELEKGSPWVMSTRSHPLSRARRQPPPPPPSVTHAGCLRYKVKEAADLITGLASAEQIAGLLSRHSVGNRCGTISNRSDDGSRGT